MIAGIINKQGLRYPSDEFYFSPSTNYPEYPFHSSISDIKNEAYDSFRQLLINLELDKDNFDTPKWNPLGKYINKNDKVFILCNFVYHKKPNENDEQFFSKCTHGSIVRAVIDYVYIAVGSNVEINFGNAPLQSCNWNSVIKDTKSNKVEEFYALNNIKVKSKDLRMTISERNFTGAINNEYQNLDNSIIEVNMDKTSLLNGIDNSNQEPKFRVSDYNPDRTEKFQNKKKHRYLINQTILNSDVIFSVPKLKTHEKVGITVGLKGIVGIVGHKDCLAHHRYGSKFQGGDEYPEKSFLRKLVSLFHDFTQREEYPNFLRPLFNILDLFFKRFIRKILGRVPAGAWYGNDTAWRMTLDLNNIIHYSDKNGIIKKDQQIRKNLVLVDGIIGGEGEGPLSPIKVETKSLIFSDNLVLGDLLSASIMKYDYEKIPLIKSAILSLGIYNKENKANQIINYNGINLDFDSIDNEYEKKYKPSKGWLKYL